MVSQGAAGSSSNHNGLAGFAVLATVILSLTIRSIAGPHGLTVNELPNPTSTFKLAQMSPTFLQSGAVDQQNPSAGGVPGPDGASSPFFADHWPVVVPFRFEANLIILSVQLNDSRERFSFMLDTGADNFIAPEVAQKLGLIPSGQYFSYGAGRRTLTGRLTRVGSVRIGKLTLRDQKFYVVQLPYALQHGFRPEIAGGIGYEFIRNLPFRVDYVRKTLTFYKTAADLPRLRGEIAVPFVLHDQVPLVAGRIEGIPGQFQIDSGSDASLSLFAPFVARHRLVELYASPLNGFAGEGVGGREVAYFVRTKVFEIGSGVVVHRMTAELLQDTAGIGADPDISGNIGTAILQRFTITFDYSHGQIYFANNGHYKHPDVFNRSGMALRITPEGVKVMTVFAEGPAAEAGIERGDVILSVDGHSGSDLDGPFLTKIFREPVGTVLRLKVLHHGTQRDLALTLRELLG